MRRQRLVAVAVAVVVGLVVAGAAVGLPAMDDGDEMPDDSPPETADRSPSAETVNGTVIQPADGSLVLQTTVNETVRGTTDLEPGTSLRVRLRNAGGSSPFIHQRDATVQENGTFRATVDLSHIEHNATASVTVLRDGETVANRTAAIEYVPGASSDDETSRTAGQNGTRLVFDGDNLTVQNASDQTISGSTDLSSETELTIRARSTDSGTPFLRQSTVVVQSDGTFATTMDFESVPENTTFEVSVRHDGERLTNAPGRVA